MPNRVRDLEQLQEQASDERERKRGTLALAAFAILGLAFAIGMVVGKAVEEPEPARDPLDQLDRVAQASHASSDSQPSAAEPAKNAAAAEPVEAADLSFERRLTAEEERPEVLAALEAAAREEERLAIHTAAAVARAPEGGDPEEEPILALDPDESVAGDAFAKPGFVPASLAASAANRKLERAKQHDKLVAAALPPPDGVRANRGNEGAYTLHVISYESAATAESFASALRARGHAAFVTAGQVPGRGRYHRVRVGPFATRQAAEEYRRVFEQREHMNTIVISRAADRDSD